MGIIWGLYRGYIGIISGLYRGCIWIMEKKMETTTLYRAYIDYRVYLGVI